MTNHFLTEIITLWVVIDPIGTLPVFLSVTAGLKAAVARRIAVHAVMVAFGILAFFILAGQILLNVMQIQLASFEIAGSIVLFLFALSMIFGESKVEKEQELVTQSDLERSVYPLAIPSIASPGAMLSVVVLTDNSKFSVAEQAITLGEVILILGILLLLLVLAPRIIAVIGNAGASVISRIMGLILASVAIDGIVSGVRTIMASSASAGIS